MALLLSAGASGAPEVRADETLDLQPLITGRASSPTGTIELNVLAEGLLLTASGRFTLINAMVTTDETEILDLEGAVTCATVRPTDAVVGGTVTMSTGAAAPPGSGVIFRIRTHASVPGTDVTGGAWLGLTAEQASSCVVGPDDVSDVPFPSGSFVIHSP